MTPAPDISSLSPLEKDALIQTLLVRVEALIAENAALRERLNRPPKTPSNSSTPPSQGHKASGDGKAKPKGKVHAGAHRPLHPKPTRRRDVLAERCDHCQADVSAVPQAAVHAYALAIIERDERPISEITRREIVRYLDTFEMQGSLGLIEFLKRIWPSLDSMDGPEVFGPPLIDEIRRHMVEDPDWSVEELFHRHLDVLRCSRKRLAALLELVVDPIVRHGKEQADIVERMDAILKADSYRLEIVNYISGHPIYRVRPIATGVSGRPKNLIFASNGLKPVIGFADPREPTGYCGENLERAE